MKVEILNFGKLKVVSLNRRKAIRYRCLDCSTSRKEVRNCIFKKCPLYPFRFGIGHQDAKKRSKAIRDYCLKWCMLDQKYEVLRCPSRNCPLFTYRLSRKDSSVEVKK